MAKVITTNKELKLDTKLSIQNTFDELGGWQGLAAWAKNPANTSQFYTQIWTKIIPKDIKSEITGSEGGPVKLSICWNNSDVSDAITEG